MRVTARICIALAVVCATSTTAVVQSIPSSAAAAGVSTPAIPETRDIDWSHDGPTFSWTTVSGAASYDIEVGRDQDFTTTVKLSPSTTVNTSYTPLQPLPQGDLFWHVRAVNTAGGSSFSDAVAFTTAQQDAPIVLTPDEQRTFPDDARTFPSEPIVFRWRPVAGATSYTIQIDDEQSYNAPLVEKSTSNTSYTLTSPQPPGKEYFWHVRAETASSSGTVATKWSADRHYSWKWSGPPQPLTPGNSTDPQGAPAANPSTVTDVVFSWTGVMGAKAYQLEISGNRDFTNNVVAPVTTYSTSYSPPSPLPNGSYYWRVRAVDTSGGNYSDWSAAWTFTRSWSTRPELTVPAWDPGRPDELTEVSTNPQFVWTPVDHAAYYQIQVSRLPYFGTVHGECFTNHTSFTAYVRDSSIGRPVEPRGSCTGDLRDGQFVSGQRYYWRVRGLDTAKNGTSILGEWSETSQFIFSPGVPEPSAPDTGAEVTDPALSWETVPGAASYLVTVYRPDRSVLVSQRTYATSFTPSTSTSESPGSAMPPGTYTWTVSATNGAGAVGETSAPRSFTLTPPGAATTAVPELKSADGSTDDRMPQLLWSPVTGATRYVVHLFRDGRELPTAGSTRFPSFTSPAVTLTAGSYAWWVEARDDQNRTVATSARGTFAIDAIPLVPTAGYQKPFRCTPDATCSTEADTPTLSWQGNPDAARYVVTIALDSAFTTLVTRYSTAYTTLTPRESLLDSQAGSAYYWFVSPCRRYVGFADKDCGPEPGTSQAQGSAAAFRKASRAIDLASPDAGATTDGGVVFTWNDYLATNVAKDPASSGPPAPSTAQPPTSEAQQYNLQVSTTPSFTPAAAIVDSVTTDSTTYSAADRTYPDGPLYWRVQATDASGNNQTWSETRTLSKDAAAPSTTATPDQEAGTVPYFAWTALPSTAQYNVQIFPLIDGKLAAQPLKSDTTVFSAYSLTKALPAGSYFWRVQAVDGYGRARSWSDLTALSVATAPADELSANPDPVTSDTLLLSWKRVTGAARYRVVVGRTATLSSVVTQATTSMTAWAPTSTLADQPAYYWRVEAQNADGGLLSASPTGSFGKDAASPTVTGPATRSSVPLTGAIPVTFSEQVRGISPSTLRLVVPGTAQVVGITTTPAADVLTSSATITPTTPLVPGATYAVTAGDGIVDHVGNQLTAYTSAPFRADTNVENASPAVVANWSRKASTAASGGSYDANNVSGSRAEFRFSGTNVTVLGTRASNGGYARIVVDGVTRTSTASFYATAARYRVPVYAVSGLPDGPHTVQVIALGTRPGGATGSWVFLDAFRVGSLATEQTSSAVREYLRRTSTSAASGGSYESAGHATSVATGRPGFGVRFAGTGVAVYGVRSPSFGKANVIVDGVSRGTMSLQGSASYGLQLYASPTLANGVHTVRLEAVGTATGAGSTIALDRIVVR